MKICKFWMLMLVHMASLLKVNHAFSPPHFTRSIPDGIDDSDKIAVDTTDRRNPKIFFIDARQDRGVIVQFPCEAVADPKPEYTWFFNEVGSIHYNFFDVDPNSGTLTATIRDEMPEGILYCTAENRYGKAVSDRLQIKYSVLHVDSALETLHYTVQKGDPLMIPCRGARSVPDASYSWTHDAFTTEDQPTDVRLNSRINVMENGSLWFSHVTSEDEVMNKVYRCRVYNAIKGSSQNTAASVIHVTNRTDGATELPVEHVYSRHPDGRALGIAGETIRLECLFKGGNIEGLSGPEITWSRLGKPLSSNSEVGTKNRYNELILRHLAEEDEGVYICTGGRGQSIASFSVNLQIESTPHFVRAPENVNITESENISLRCEGRAEPSPSTRWLINGLPIEDVENPRYTLSEDKKTFTIHRACKRCRSGHPDLMVVQCRIENIHGYNYTQAYINVLEITTITTPPVSQLIPRAMTRVYLDCEATSDPSTPHITYEWKHDAESITVGDTFYVHSNGTLEINVDTAEEEKKKLTGSYTCVASNRYSTDSVSVLVGYEEDPEPTKVVVTLSFLEQYWIVLLVVGVALIPICIVLVVLACKRWYLSSDEYSVDKRERACGIDPEDELHQMGFHEYQRPEPNLLTYANESEDELDDISLSSDYSAENLGRFNEHGSFIMPYDEGTARR